MRVYSGDKTLGCGFLITRGAVRLAGYEETCQDLGFERGKEGFGCEIVILDRVGRPDDFGPGEAGKCPVEGELDILGQGGG